MKKYTEMNLQELREATKRYDRPGVAMRESRPLTRAGRKLLLLAAKRAAVRPRVGSGSKNIHITLEAELLSRADAEARRQRIGRSELIARGLEMALQKAS